MYLGATAAAAAAISLLLFIVVTNPCSHNKKTLNNQFFQKI